MVIFNLRNLFTTIGEELIIIQITIIARDTVIATHIDSFRHLFASHQSLIQLFTMTCTNHSYLSFTILRIHLCICFLQSLSQGFQSCSRSLLYKQITILTMCERIDHQIHCIVQGHHETSHIWIGNRNRFTLFHLFHPQRNHRTTRSHHITVARTTDSCCSPFTQFTTFGNRHLFHQRFRNTHRINRISRFIGRKYHHILHPMFDSRKKYIFCTQYIRTSRLHREEFTRRHLFQCSCSKHIIHTTHCHIDRSLMTYITDVEFHFSSLFRILRLKMMTHIILFLFITREDTNLLDVAIQEATKYSIPK